MMFLSKWRSLLNTVFYVTSLSWIIFSLLEWRFTGLVSNFFSVHIFLLLALISVILSGFLKDSS